jgi:alpha-beta hydrolase superfamily lysophospholipase
MDYEGSFKSSDGLDFYERGWEPDGEVLGRVVFIHGYGEHCSRYIDMGRVFSDAGFSVHTFDQRGYGHSPGKRAYIHDFNVLLSDMDAYLAHIRPRLSDKPWFLMGHSMGGLVLASYAETRTLDARGLVFCSSFLAINPDVPPVLLRLANILGTLAPWLPVSGVDNRFLSRDPKIVEAADNDPLSNHGPVRARTGAQFNRAITRARENFHRISLPAYIIHGGDDRVVPNEGSRLLYEKCSSKDKTLKIYEGGYHELWNDLDKEAALAGICDWMRARI